MWKSRCNKPRLCAFLSGSMEALSGCHSSTALITVMSGTLKSNVSVPVCSHMLVPLCSFCSTADVPGT
jgi:hypothetical protein